MVQETEPGRMLAGRYRLSRQERSGRYGRVWRAYDRVGREVTVEEVGAAGSAETSWAVRILWEATALRGHPSVMPVTDVVLADGAMWAVVPVVRGPSLADLLAERGRMSGTQVWAVALSMLDALEAMHAAGLIHGDVRPVNIRDSGSQ